MSLIDFLQSGNLFALFFKLFGVVLGGLYVFFSVIMIRQIKAMQRVVRVRDNGVLRFLSYVQLVAALIILIYALFILS